VLSPSAASDVAFAVRRERLPSRLSAIAVSRVSSPSSAFAIPPTALAATFSGLTPRMLTACRADSSDSRFVRTPTIVCAAG
jgi:hypothetical protein